MKRGEIWTVAGGFEYAGKPRPAVIVQDDRFADMRSVTLCMFTTNSTPARAFRVDVAPTEENGLKQPSALMADKLTTVGKDKLGYRVGRLDDETMLRLNRAVAVFLGIAG